MYSFSTADIGICDLGLSHSGIVKQIPSQCLAASKYAQQLNTEPRCLLSISFVDLVAHSVFGVAVQEAS